MNASLVTMPTAFNREVYNHIAPIIEARLAKLCKISPLLAVKQSSNSESDFYSSKLAKLILQSVVSKNNLKDIMNMANFCNFCKLLRFLQFYSNIIKRKGTKKC